MRTTIDAAGRVVIPKPLREAAGLVAGTEIEVELHEGRIEIEPTPVEMRLVDAPHGAVIQADEPMPTITVEEVRALLERTRR